MTETELIAAAKVGDETGVAINIHLNGQKDADGMTALMHAARGNHSNVIRSLIDSECFLSDDRGWTALAYAIANGSLDCIDALRMEYENRGITLNALCEVVQSSTGTPEQLDRIRRCYKLATGCDYKDPSSATKPASSPSSKPQRVSPPKAPSITRQPPPPPVTMAGYSSGIESPPKSSSKAQSPIIAPSSSKPFEPISIPPPKSSPSQMSIYTPFRSDDPSNVPVDPSCCIGIGANTISVRPTQCRPTMLNGNQLKVSQGDSRSPTTSDQLNGGKKIRELERQVRDLQEELKQYKNDGVALSNSAKAKDMDMRKLLKENETLRLNLQKKEREVDELRHEMAELQKFSGEHGAEEDQKRQAFIDRINELVHELDHKKKEMELLEAECNIEKQAKKNLEDDNVHLRDMLHKAETAAKAATAEVDFVMARDNKGRATVRLPLSDGGLTPLSRTDLDALRTLLTNALEDLMGRILKVSTE